MNPENEIVIKEIVGAIRRMVRAVYLDTSKMSRQFGLTGAQSGVLRNLVQDGPLSSVELSRRLHVTPSNITGIIDRLEKKGFVSRTRNSGDRRIVTIALTVDGEKLGRQLPDPVESKLISGLSDLEPLQVQNLRRALDQLLNLIDARYLSDMPLEIHSPGTDQGVIGGGENG
ncbi:MAG: MarR family transcriptional regulator [Deltaproteobacteria bacterium]|nr:MarR family transcriptional regulator [Deltaproteobacteria bacterium]MBW2137805.1 MarR family transcriptional regulator [Deltaproteobacteria bacterium]